MASSGTNNVSTLAKLESITEVKKILKSPTEPLCSSPKESAPLSVSDSENFVFPIQTSNTANNHQMEANSNNDIPQWKKDLIQRRKNNIVKTIAAGSINNFKEDVAFVSNTTVASVTSKKCDNSVDKLIQSTRNHKVDEIDKSITSHNLNTSYSMQQKPITSTDTTNTDTTPRMTVALQFQQPLIKKDLLRGSRCTHINNKSDVLLNIHTKKLPENSVHLLQTEHEQPPKRTTPADTKVLESISYDGSISTLPHENQTLRNNSTLSTSSDSLFSTSVSNSSGKTAAELFKIHNKEQKDKICSASATPMCVNVEHHSNDVVQQEQESTLTNTNIYKLNTNENIDDNKEKDDYNEHQLASGCESGSLSCVVNRNKIVTRKTDSEKNSNEYNNKINDCNSNPQLTVLNTQKTCGIANASSVSVRSVIAHASTAYKKNQIMGYTNDVSKDANNKNCIKQRSNQNCLTHPVATTSVATHESSISIKVNNNINKMVAVQEINDKNNIELNFDPSEELQYGPGIVSKLRCRYLSLALRQSMDKHRSPLDSLRRATSLNNLLDGNDIHEGEDEDEEENGDVEDSLHTINKTKTGPSLLSGVSGASSILKTKEKIIESNKIKIDSSENKTSPVRFAYINQNRSRHIKRGNDSLKRARSVEALLCEKSPWNYYNSQPTIINKGAADIVTIDDKINNARERLISGSDHSPPKRLTSIIDDTERPPPDLVKQTLKIFEASANRRSGRDGGEVATKVANYKGILTQNKPSIVFSKPLIGPKTFKQKNNHIEAKTNVHCKSSSILVPTDQQLEKCVVPMNHRNIIRTTQPKAESSSKKNLECFKSDHECLSENATDCNLVEETVATVHSPVVEQTKLVDMLQIKQPTIKTSTNHNQQSVIKENKFSLNSSEIETEKNKNSTYVVNNEKSNSTKLISKTVLENKAKDESNQQILSQKSNSIQFSKGNYPTCAPLHDIPSLPISGITTNSTVKQIGVIRPLLVDNSQNQPEVNFTEEMSNDKRISTELTSREIEKNRINNEKKTKSFEIKNSLGRNELDVVASKIHSYNVSGSDTGCSSESNSGSSSSVTFYKKKRSNTGTIPENNSMVFNFKDRKNVPDYIDNDGIIFKHKRELPKPNEPGFVLLGDLSRETSTDPDEEWPMCPPSPCNVEFENAHIIIDGKSNIKSRSKEVNFRVQFDDTLNSTFEYPSESSVIENSGSDYADLSSLMSDLNVSSLACRSSTEESNEEKELPIQHHHVKSEEIIQLPHNNQILGNLSLDNV